MSKDVYIVHCIDTEGPLYESLGASFDRLKDIFGIEMEPTRENMRKLQNQELDLGGQEELVADAFAQKRINTYGSWTEIDAMLNVIMEEDFRKRLPDSDGNGWVFSWFPLDHVGFTGKNPRRRDAGYGNIYTHYLEEHKHHLGDDILQFHYHPLPFNGDYNYGGTTYVSSDNLFTILAHRILDNHMFPCAYRAGYEAERPDSHWFLEQWIPFDFSCNSFRKEDLERQPDLRNGRYGDWRHATRHWHPYHPSHDNYQLEGNCRRWISRCLSIDSRLVKMNLADVRQAFVEAEENHPSIMAFASHDFRDMRREIGIVTEMIKEVKKEFPDVRYHYASAIEAMRKAEHLAYKKCGLSAEIRKTENGGLLHIKAEDDIFGVQPFLALKTKSNQYLWDNLDMGETGREWTYCFDANTLLIDAVEEIGIAANSSYGISEVLILNPASNKSQHFVWNE